MRWVAVAGQVGAIAVALLFFNAPLDLVGLGGAVAVAAATNAFAMLHRPWLRPVSYGTLFVLLTLDTLLLTAMLLLAGGLHNPFTSFFLLHVTLATVLLRRREATALTVLCFLCVLAIYRFPGADHHAHHWITMEMHFTGMMFTLFATGTCILLFVGRLQAALREQERLVQEQELQLGRQQRVVGLATLAAGVAHELATPLSTIAVASHELRVTAGQFCQSKSCLADSALIRQEVDRCRAIIDRLSAPRAGEGGRRVLGFDAAALQAMLSGYLPAASFGRLIIDCPQRVDVEVDEVGFFQSLAALIKNGCDADSSGGPVRLAVREEEGMARFEVCDAGCGIPADVLQRLGDPFVTTKEPGRGIGLGLYLVHLFCYLHEASVRFLPRTDGPGTRVLLDLPLRVHA